MSCHKRGMNFLNAHRSFEPFTWEEALLLDGSWDVGFARWLFERYNLFATDPTAIVLGEDKEIRAAASADLATIAIYSPYAFDIDVAVDLTGYRCVLIDLATRRVMTPEVQASERSRIGMSRVNADTLFLAVKQPISES